MAAGPTDMGVSWGREDSHGPAVAARLERAVDAAHTLSELLWAELQELRPAGRASTRRGAELAERIADLASTLALLAREGEGATSAPAVRAVAASVGASESRPAAALVDEADAPVPRDPLPGSGARRAGERIETDPRAGAPPWLGLIEGALDRFERDRVPFAVLLVEVLDVGGAARVSEEVGRTIARALDAIRPAWMSPEGAERYWMLVPRADRLGARVVADRLAHAVGPVEDLSGQGDAADTYFAALSARASRPNAAHAATPLRLAVGAAACPEDGRDVSALVAHAHIELAAARSASLPLVAVSEPA